MTKKLLGLSLIMGLSATHGVFAASDNTITFQGEVTDQTCAVTVNGSHASPVVLLPTVSIADFSSATTTGATSFEVGISGCATEEADRTISTVFVGNQVTPSGNLGNTGTAGNVEIQILDATGNVIDFTDRFTGNGDLTLTAGETSATAGYIAQYYTTGTPTAGDVTASLQYSVSYL
ncbi:type 1 fimbrial protein [Enterobacter oligotrophicus]|nr:type 1 fimbrial protein [Enterobacter oligotrophicus]